MSRSRGPKKAAPRKFNEKVHVEAFACVLEPAVMTQAKQLAGMPFIHPHVALMPDAHVGMGSSVGTVFGTIGAVIPAAVGVDIGCGMIGVGTQVQDRQSVVEGRERD